MVALAHCTLGARGGAVVQKGFIKEVILELSLERWENVPSRGKSFNRHRGME